MTDWQPMTTAPRDGRPIHILVEGRCGLGWPVHELPYPVCFIDGRWCYARNRAPVFPWHQPRRWREIESVAA